MDFFFFLYFGFGLDLGLNFSGSGRFRFEEHQFRVGFRIDFKIFEFEVRYTTLPADDSMADIEYNRFFFIGTCRKRMSLVKCNLS